MTTTPQLQQVDHIHVFVADRAAAEVFYAQVLGLTRVPRFAQWAVDGGPLFLANATDTVRLALFQARATPCRSTIALSASAEQFLAWRTHLATHLGDSPLRLEDHALSWSLYFTDPDGNPYEITTYDYPAVAEAVTKSHR